MDPSPIRSLLLAESCSQTMKLTISSEPMRKEKLSCHWGNFPASWCTRVRCSCIPIFTTQNGSILPKISVSRVNCPEIGRNVRFPVFAILKWVSFFEKKKKQKFNFFFLWFLNDLIFFYLFYFWAFFVFLFIFNNPNNKFYFTFLKINNFTIFFKITILINIVFLFPSI